MSSRTLNAWTHPSANNRLDPMADAFALWLEPAAFQMTHQRIAHSVPFRHDCFVVVWLPVIAFKAHTTHCVAAQIPIAF